MNESFELLSSMSPKTKGRQQTLKKSIKILALKKNIRRFSTYHKVPPAVGDEDLAIVEASTESSSSTSCERNTNKNDQNNVIIIDSTDSEDSEDPPRLDFKKQTLELIKKPNKKETKLDRVRKWLNNIDLEEKNDNLTFYSQVSTIYGDEANKVDCDGNGLAASSTFNECLIRRFDELFVADKNVLKNKSSDENNLDDSFSNEINTSLNSKLKKLYSKEAIKESADKQNKSFDSGDDSLDFKKVQNNSKEPNYNKMEVIDETLLTSDESIINKSESPKLTPIRMLEQPLYHLDEFVTTRKKNAKIAQYFRSSVDDLEEMETLLDSLYGVKWRQKHDHVLPSSELKKKPEILNQEKFLRSDTERIMKPLKKENIQNTFNPSTKKLNFDRLSTPSASPWVQRLNGLVDSDSDSNTENRNEITKGVEGVKTRLNFNENSSSIKPDNRVKITHKELKINKIEFDDSSSEESLEEGIKRKMNNFKISKEINQNSNKKNVKKSGNKENDPNNENISKGTTNKKNLLLKNKNNGKSTTKATEKKTDNKTSSKNTSPSNSCSEIEISSDEEYDNEITRMYEVKRKSFMSSKGETYSFLESLSACVPLNKCHMTARIFRANFKEYRDELKKKLFALYNEKLFGNAIPSDTELEWNIKLRNTAGLCYCKKITHQNGRVERKVKISLSSKVLDSPDRLRDTLIHEMCHAGTWIINEISNGHGIYWKNWAFKAMKIFPELPPIKRCHSYQINTKYTYKCTKCGYSFGRHTKSLDLERKRCGHCIGKFELLINKTYKSGETKSVPVTPRKEGNAFSLFVKENYAKYKDPSKKHGDVMKVLGQKFSELKVKNAG